MLLPVTTFERQAVGLFPLDTSARGFGTDLEGGYVGQVIPGVGTQHNAAVIGRPVTGDGYGSDSATALLGLMDDSSTGSKDSGTANSGVLGMLVPAVGAKTALGYSSTAGSGKGTIWIEPGIFITDQIVGLGVAGVSMSTGTVLYATSTGKLSTVAGSGLNAVAIATVLQTFTGGLTSITAKELLGVLPRTQSLPTGTTLALIKFK
jgi:hypothetical protein